MPDTLSTVNYQNGDWLNFENVEDPAILIPLLKERLPMSCMVSLRNRLTVCDNKWFSKSGGFSPC